MPCPTASKCTPCNPVLANLSSEDEDFFDYLGLVFASQGPPITPNLGWQWTQSGCVAECVSTISQDDADQCAARQQLQCNIDGSLGGDGNPISIFCNAAQSCVLDCKDGLPFTYTVPPVQFCSTSQTLANRIAMDYACSNVKKHQICLSALNPNTGTVGVAFTATITASGGFLSANANFWNVVTGTFPPGLDFPNIAGPQITITGTPTQSGTFTFTLQIQVPNGDFMQKQYTVTVAAVATKFYWTFDEPNPGDDRVDKFKSLHLLAQVGVVGLTPPSVDTSGLYVNGVQFNHPNDVSTTLATCLLTPGIVPTSTLAYSHGNGFTWWGWIKANNVTIDLQFIYLFQLRLYNDSVGSVQNAFFSIFFSSGILSCQGADLINNQTVNNLNTIPFTPGVWHFVAFKYDPSAGLFYSQVNQTGWQASSIPLNVQTSPYGFFEISSGGGGAGHYDWTVDETGLVYEVLSDSQIARIYNNGTGVTWPAISSIV